MNRLLQYLAGRDFVGLIADTVIIALGAGFLVEMTERALFGLS